MKKLSEEERRDRSIVLYKKATEKRGCMGGPGGEGAGRGRSRPAAACAASLRPRRGARGPCPAPRGAHGGQRAGLPRGLALPAPPHPAPLAQSLDVPRALGMNSNAVSASA